MFDTSPVGLASLIARGESASVQFKERPDILRTFLARYVIRFANSEGGIILFGVGDDGQIVG